MNTSVEDSCGRVKSRKAAYFRSSLMNSIHASGASLILDCGAFRYAGRAMLVGS